MSVCLSVIAVLCSTFVKHFIFSLSKTSSCYHFNFFLAKILNFDWILHVEINFCGNIAKDRVHCMSKINENNVSYNSIQLERIQSFFKKLLLSY